MTAEEPAEAPGKTLRNQPPSSGPFRSVPFRSVRPSVPPVVLFRCPGPSGECSCAGEFWGLEGPREVLSICTLPETRPCTESGTHRGGWGGSRKSGYAPPGRESCRKSSQNTCFQPYPGHLDSGVRFRTLITSCARSGLTQDSLGGGRGPGGGSPLAGVRGQSPRKEIFGSGTPSQAENLQESAPPEPPWDLRFCLLACMLVVVAWSPFCS